MAIAERPDTSSVAVLVMARTLQRVAADRDDPLMMSEAKDFEKRALAAIKVGCSTVGPKPAQLRLLGM